MHSDNFRPRFARISEFYALVGILMALTAIGKQALCAPLHGKVSYQRQVWPILQAKCQGCHQPASPGGKLSVTSYADFKKGGEHGAAFLAGKPETSPVMSYLMGTRTLMPKGGPALPLQDIALIRRWITEGAKDDTVAARDAIDAAHPPQYFLPPVIAALAYSPDGKTLAVSGYREVLLHRADGSGLRARLVGQSQKIQSIVYSVDGRLLAAVGGDPALFGEIQFWDTATNKEMKSVKSTFDTVFGASLSTDGKQLAFGGADNSVRVVTVPDGKQTMRLDNHSDWVFATAFSMDGKNVLSVSRDQAIKLTLIDGASFIDDINTHFTALRCLVRNPKSDQVACAGDDGIPRIYKIFRTEARTMNQEDHNLIRALEKQPGPSTALAFNADGTMLAVGGEQGIVNLYSATDGKFVVTLPEKKGVIFALAFQPDGKRIATGGFDGHVRLYNLPGGTLFKDFLPVPITVSHRTTASLARPRP